MSRVIPRVPGESATVTEAAAPDLTIREVAEVQAERAERAATRRQPIQIDTSEPSRPLPSPVAPMDYDVAMAGLLNGTLHVPLFTTQGYLVDQPLIERAG